MRYVEYDLISGLIICELEEKPSEKDLTQGCAVLEIEDDKLDLSAYIIQNGVLVNAYESDNERKERERFKRENAERLKKRIRDIQDEFILAMLDDNQDTVKALKDEFKILKRCF